MKTLGYAAEVAGAPLVPFIFNRRELRPNDVAIDILYCGVCHSDLHHAHGDWPWTQFPVVPGHEIVGRVIRTGNAVSDYKVGDVVAVGCMVDSCQQCDQCERGEEQFCRKGLTETYNSPDRVTGETLRGGYSTNLVVRQEFLLRVPTSLELSRVAPLLCAGITTYSPLRTFNVGPGSRVGVVGLGGLGHMAVKLAVSMGADVTVISRTTDKQADASALGAHHFLASSDEASMQQAASRFDLIIDTVPVQHDVMPYLPLLDVDGTLVIVGQVGDLSQINSVPFILGRRRVAGSVIGGIRETQEMLDFCAEKGVLPECEMIRMDEINEAFERMERADVRYRFVIDMASLKASE
ncbi:MULTISPECIES: NAD(P)-dependent alcohol dehydrogenase [Pseudomonas]|uniref:NAD(P)-dependent alcohol dehydrogenase n=1 Tax=Pseudomonas TaxID=286 RepID=UPI003822C40C